MTPTILTFILDDDPSIATFIDKLLNKGSFNIIGFTEPETFKQALNHNVNLVLLDISIPGHEYDIHEMMNYLHEEYPGIYIIIISGHLTLDNVLKFWRNGAFDALVAEYGAEAIVTAIKGHVSPDTGTNFKQQS